MPIVVKDLSHIYSRGTPFESRALDAVSVRVDDGEFVGIVGPTGAGKSTLIQHFNGLLRPTAGTVMLDGRDLAARDTDLRKVRQQVGIIFQYPEHQLFEETVSDDIAFGPRNLGLNDEQVAERVTESMALVGLEPQLAARSPFELSGGQMRRVAIAGVLAMRPRVLILDEPTAGLDPRGRHEILGHVTTLHARQGITVILVTHNMEDVARLSRRVIVMQNGTVAMDGATADVFSQRQRLLELGLEVPPVTELALLLTERGIRLPRLPFTVEDATEMIMAAAERGQIC